MSEILKINLGCGENHKPGYINVDKYGDPDVMHDLETFPWPWEDSSVTEILLIHALEHMGQETSVYLDIIKEIYRICRDQAVIQIAVPHPRHDDFINDPTHVRVVTPESLSLFSKRNNKAWIEGGFSNSPLGIYLSVDFEVTNVSQILDPPWAGKLQRNEISEAELAAISKQYNNVIREYQITVKAIKAPE